MIVGRCLNGGFEVLEEETSVGCRMLVPTKI